MKRRVVDTNVAVVANGRDTTAGPRCRRAAVEALGYLLQEGRIVVDRGGEILDEYRRYCSPKGEPGVGDRFFREVLMNYAERIERIELPKHADGSYVDFPTDPELHRFDASDRKFVAACRRSGAAVMNATDSDWLHHRSALIRNKVEIDFVCGDNSGAWNS